MSLVSADPPRRSHLRGAGFWAAYVAYFVVGFILRFVYFWVGDLAGGRPGTLGERLLDEGTGAAAAVVVALAIVYLLRRVPIDGRWRRWLPLYTALFVGVTVVHTLLMSGARVLLAPPLLGHGYGVGPLGTRLLFEAANDVFGFTAFVAFFALGDAWAARRERERRAAELERSLGAAQLQNLRLRLQPHFLFNALNAVSERMYDDPAAADEMLARLADLLRRSLATVDATVVPLAEELALLDDYAAIMGARFGDRLSIVREIADDVGDALVPPFLLQPLVENAVRHGNAARLGAGAIAVRARQDGSALRLEVEDDGDGADGADSSGFGVGLRSARERLTLLYGSEATLAAGAVDAGYRVTITLPLRRATAASLPSDLSLDAAVASLARPDR